MDMPQELEVWYVIPALRKSFAELMLKKGLKQKEIAEKMNLGKSAVSQYLKSQRGTELKFDKHMLKKIEESVDKILKEKSNVRAEIMALCGIIKEEGLLCCFHKSKYKNLKKCEVCLK
ncbi:MAG: helix-turn-helix domain-containing protein [Nanoarchaeota archaeon]|nr:helix-turn-helix domain-containing protein [Nanoarchaeota archaeon]MCG2717595.1 helix-turn-helix domain-containing protein [Nanoarchaeota archaeon]